MRIITDGVSQLSALFRQEGVLLACQHLRETVDDVQRCTDLMAHISDKLHLHIVGSRHTGIGSAQFRVLNQQVLSGPVA